MRSLARALSRLVFGNEGLSRRLERVAAVQAVARHLRVREWMNAGLALRPIRRTLAGSGVTYLVETFETLAVEQTYFGHAAMTSLFAGNPPETFVDLGCNSGIFPCYLAHVGHGRAPRGICVDANAVQVELARKNAALNGWKDVHFFYGLVGSAKPGEPASEFYMAPTSLGSSQFAYQETESGYPLDWKRTVVPVLLVAPAWTRLFGPDQRCHCLKIDIEGSEMLFLQQESAFLERVDSILLEWHLWATTRDEVVQFLIGHQFQLEQTLEDEPRHGLLFFRNSRTKKGRGE